MGALGDSGDCAMDSITRFISTARVSSTHWKTWLQNQKMERVSTAQLVRSEQRLVVVSPHPDDEVIACGGLIASHLANGGSCLVIAVTDGEASHKNTPNHDPLQLKTQRQYESDAGLRCLGVPTSAVVRLSLPDGGVSMCGVRLIQRLQALLKPDDVVITTWRLDGHPDHEACGMAVSAVCEDMGARLLEAPVWMWHWATTADKQVNWSYLKAWPMDQLSMARKLKALAEHRSQLSERPGRWPPVLDSAIVERAGWPTEYYFLSHDCD